MQWDQLVEHPLAVLVWAAIWVLLLEALALVR
jgi:hypothetical protein